MKKLLLILLLLSIVFSSCSTVEPATIGKSSEVPIYVSYPTVSVNFTGAEEDEHHLEHEDGGADLLKLDNLSGKLIDDQHVLDTEVINAIENVNDTLDIDNGSGELYLRTSDANEGLRMYNSKDVGNIKGSIRMYSTDANPDQYNQVFSLLGFGTNNITESIQYYQFYVRQDSILDGSESGRAYWLLINSGSLDVAMYLTNTGKLYIDDSYETFDNYDDALLLKLAIQGNKPELLEQAGIYTRKYKLDSDGNETDIFDGYMVNIQAMMKLNSGGVYQLLDHCESLEARIIELEKLLE